MAKSATVEKWFLFSRRLWSLATPIAVLVWSHVGNDPGTADTEGLQTALLGFGEQLALVFASGIGLWSFLKPDNAALTVIPTAEPE